MLPANELDRYRDTIDGLGALLRSVGYNEDALPGLLTFGDGVDASWSSIPIHARRLTSEEGVVGLVRFFLLGLPMSSNALGSLVHPVSLGGLAELGLIEIEAGTGERPYASRRIATCSWYTTRTTAASLPTM